MKRCSKCGEDKRLEEFHNRKKSADGKHVWCRPCMNSYSGIRYRKRHDYYKRKNRENHRLRSYGVSPEQYENLVVAQCGTCAICGRPEASKANSGEVRTLAVDHDHKTGEVRGLLCDACNRGIGFMGDDSERLQVAADYVRGFSTNGR